MQFYLVRWEGVVKRGAFIAQIGTAPTSVSEWDETFSELTSVAKERGEGLGDRPEKVEIIGIDKL